MDQWKQDMLFIHHYSLPLLFHYKPQLASSTCIKYSNI